MSDYLMYTLDQQVRDSIESNDLDGVDKYLDNLEASIRSHRSTVKLTRDRLFTITDDEITAIKDKLDSAFNLTWGCQIEPYAVVFGAAFKDIKLDVFYYYAPNKRWSNSYGISGWIDIDKGEDTEVLLIDKEDLQSIDEVIEYISTFFLRLRESANYICTKN